MASASDNSNVGNAMREINQAWLGGHVDDLIGLVHPNVVMVFPGFSGRVQGRDGLLAGFKDFVSNATVREFKQDEPQVDVIGETAVVTYGYVMHYARAGVAYRATGRDLWVFQKQEMGWVAVWRTMLDLSETPD